MAWSAEEKDKLKEYWAEGYSATQVAHLIPNKTRNSILGVVFREGLTKNGTVKMKQAPRLKISSREIKAPTPLKEEVEKNPVLADSGNPFTLKDLPSSGCKWPIGDPEQKDFHFCGHSRRVDGPYCDTHAKAGYQPAPPRRHRRGP